MGNNASHQCALSVLKLCWSELFELVCQNSLAGLFRGFSIMCIHRFLLVSWCSLHIFDLFTEFLNTYNCAPSFVAAMTCFPLGQ